MTGLRRFAGTLVCVAAIGASSGCDRAPEGVVSLSWTGRDTGAATLQATARRCGTGPLELFGTAGDTGIGVVVDPSGGDLAGDYPVSAASGRRAQVATRWTDSLSVAGYRGTSGTAVLSAEDSTISGALTAEATDSGSGRQVTLLARFSRIPVSSCDSTVSAPP